MERSKSTFITIEDETLLKWKKSICRDMSFSTSRLRPYFPAVAAMAGSKPPVGITAGFILPCPVMIACRIVSGLPVLASLYPGSTTACSWTFKVLFFNPPASIRIVFHLINLNRIKRILKWRIIIILSIKIFQYGRIEKGSPFNFNFSILQHIKFIPVFI